MSVNRFSSAREMRAALDRKDISARELLALHVEQQVQSGAAINAVIRQDLDRANKEAAAIDDARARGDALGPLAGLPMTIKDAFDIAGMPAHSGNPAFADRPLNCADAEVVTRARAAGAIVWGKTNVPYMLEEWQSFNSLYGTTNNPYDTGRTPGGSSGGSAAALAAGLTPLEIGSDIGGSLRVPAHYCGVVSCKPTWGRLPQAGHIIRNPELDPEVDLNVVGPMARNIGDLRLLFQVLCQTTSTAEPIALSGLRIGVWSKAKGFALGQDARAALERAADVLSNAGARVSATKPPVDTEQLLVCYRDLLLPVLTESTRDLPSRSMMRSLRPLFGIQRALGAGPLTLAGYGLGLSATPAQFARAKTTRDQLKVALRRYFETTDVIVAPVTAAEAFAHNQAGPLISRSFLVDGKRTPMVSNLQWIALASALHVPALVVPVGKTSKGLPLGVQLIGPWDSEALLMDLGEALEQKLGGYSPPAGF